MQVVQFDWLNIIKQIVEKRVAQVINSNKVDQKIYKGTYRQAEKNVITLISFTSLVVFE